LKVSGASLVPQLSRTDPRRPKEVTGLGHGVKVSALLNAVNDAIAGRLLVFFPGDVENNNFRLLDARDGSDCMALCDQTERERSMPITNRELFYRDPTDTKIPNGGVAKVVRPETDQQ
jgi:hypothetical protein